MNKQNRRHFLVTASRLGVVGLFTLTGIGCSEDPVSPDYSGVSGTFDIDLADYPALEQEDTSASIGGSQLGRPLIVTHTSSGFHALDSFCTHQGCTVHAGATLDCPCHGSHFSLTGDVTHGPATKDLRSFPITRDGDILTVNFE
ncbi:Rieske (2Fe-2S) protein [bacterium]|nr:Rieske (2Fe-2S) protein [bacterium]